MASRRFDIYRILGIGRTVVQGRFFPQGAGNPIINSSNKGKGYTVTKNVTAGNYTITFADSYVDLDSMTASVQTSVFANAIVVFGTYSAAARTLLMQVKNGGLDADFPADPNNSISFHCVFRNSSVPF